MGVFSLPHVTLSQIERVSHMNQNEFTANFSAGEVRKMMLRVRAILIPPNKFSFISVVSSFVKILDLFHLNSCKLNFNPDNLVQLNNLSDFGPDAPPSPTGHRDPTHPRQPKHELKGASCR